MKKRIGMVTLTAFLSAWSLLITSSARAQDEIPTKITNQNRSGDLPFSGSVGSEIERVDIASGNLIVTVPIASVPGRGMDMGLSLRYGARFLAMATRIDPWTGAPYHIWNIEKDRYLTGSLTGVGWATNGSDITYGTTQLLCYLDSGEGTWWMSVSQSYMLRDATGGKHKFAYQKSASCPPNTSDFDKPDLTANGMKAVWALVYPKVLHADGTQRVYGTAYSWQDSNGNQRGEAPDGNDTLGRVPVTMQTGSNQILYKAYDSSGVQRTYTVNLTTVAMATQFNASGPYGPATEFSGNRQVISSIVLPNGRSYSFQYNAAYAEITRIDLPTGGYITFTWGVLSDQHKTHRYVTSRTLNVNGQNYTWLFSRSGSGDNISVTVTDPDQNQAVYQTFAGSITSAKLYQGAAVGTPLREHTMTYSHDGDPFDNLNSNDPVYEPGKTAMRLLSITTKLETGLVSKKEFGYDQITFDFHDCLDAGCWNGSWPVTQYVTSRGNVTEIREYDWGQGAPGPLIRRTVNTYLHDANPTYLTYNIVDKIAAQTVYDGAGNQVAHTQFEYDNYVPGENALLSTTGAPQHDYASFSTSFIYRGNATRVKRWRNTDGAMLTTTYTYDDLGNIRAIKDPQGHITSYSYTDSWANSSCLPPTNSQAYVTQTTNPLSQRIQFKYWPCTGLRQARKDENDILAGRTGVTSTYDLLGRLTQQNLPDGGQVTKTYTDVPPVKVATTTKITAAMNLSAEEELDGLGRVMKTRLLSDPQGVVFTDTTYDSSGRVKTVSNPYRLTSDPTYGITTTEYDALGRVTKVIPPDGTASANHIATNYSGNSTTVTDQAGKQRRSFGDALGRLIQVDEPTPSGPTPGTGSATISGTEQSIPGSGPTPGTGSVNITGNEQYYEDGEWQWVCVLWLEPEVCGQWEWQFVGTTIWDSGGVSVTVNGQIKSTTYGQGSTGNSIATALRNAINADSNYPVTASVSGTVLSLTSKITGSSSNYPLSASSYSNDPAHFTPPSFVPVPSGSTLTGGGPGSGATYDTGNVWVTVNGQTKNVTYGQASTSATVASALATAINADGGYPATAVLAGSSLTLTAKTSGASTNYSLSGGSSTGLPGTFSQPSFTVSVSGSSLVGGSDTGPGTLATPAVTQYTYDTLDNLTCVVQKGTDSAPFTTCAAAPAAWRPRGFTYNSLSQLLTATNPESGAISYTYDSDGNLITKTDARGIVATHTYDALHRLTQKSFSDGTPTATLSYDTGSGYQINMVGRLSKSCWEGTYANCDWFGYDPMGRVTRHEQGGGLWPSTLYTYNLAGSVTDLGYYEYYTGKPTRWIRYSYDSAGRVNRAEETWPAQKVHADNIQYHPHGAWSSMTLSNGAMQQSAAYNSRLQPTVKTVTKVSPASTIMNFTYSFVGGAGQNNGNVQAMNDTVQALNYGFQYDELNRLARAETTNTNLWGNTYVYDIWANLFQKNQIAGKQQGEFFQQTMNSKNQFVGWSYDAAGNLLNDGAHSYQYDPEGRIRCMDAGANCASAAASYVYSVEGRRVKRTVGGASTLYLHDGGSVLSEFSNPSPGVGTWQKDYIYLGGQLLASESASDGTRYHFSDHLGTPRVVTSAAGSVVSRHDYYPYGQEITAWSDGETHKFTGKERDSESNLDYFIARYYSSAQGRFLSPDEFTGGPVDAFSSNDPLPPGPLPYADITNPQSLNKYTYTYNNPLRYTDPNGHDPGDKFKKKDQAAVDAILYMRKLPNGYNWEYGTRIRSNPDKTFSYIEPVTQQNPKGVDYPPLQKDDVGDVHTHNYGVGDDAHANSIEQPDMLSTIRTEQDVQAMQDDPKSKVGYQSYVAAPNGDVLRFTPNPKASNLLGDVKTVKKNVAPDPNPPGGAKKPKREEKQE